MPASFQIDPDKRLITVLLQGKVTAEDLNILSRDLGKHAGFKPTYNRLIDLSQMDKIEINTDSIRELAKSSEDKFDESSRRAIIATSDFMYGISRMYQAISNKITQTRVFRTRDEAENWLKDPAS